MATSNYPGSLDDYSTLPSSGSPITVSSHYFGPAITNIETELGTDPAGSFTDVKSRLDSGLVTQADIWRLTANVTSDGVITSNLERADDASSGLLGTGMTESSGIFSFPETGIYLVIAQVYLIVNSDFISLVTEVTINNSTYDTVAVADLYNPSGLTYSVNTSQALIDVTDISNVKVRFSASSIASPSYIYGDTGYNTTAFSFIRLGGT